MNITELLTELRSIRDEREQLASRDKALSDRESYIKDRLMDYHVSTGLDSVSGGGLTISYKEKLRAGYDPEKWTDIMRWAVNTGHEYLIQRRLTDSRVADLATSGVELPEGLRIETFTDISVRRK